MRIVVLALFLSWLSCAFVRAETPATSEWTVLVYAVGDAPGNARSIRRRLKSLERLAALKPGAPVRIIVQHDEAGHDPGNRYLVGHIVHPSDTDRLDTPALAEADIRAIDPAFRYGERDSASPAALKAFLTWGMRAYPARHHALVLMGDGGGTAGILADHWGERGGISPPSRLRHRDIRRVVEELAAGETAGGALDVLVLDTAGAGQLEALLEYRQIFRYTVASAVEAAPELFSGAAISRLVTTVASAPGGSDTATHALVEDEWLRPWIASHVERVAHEGRRAGKVTYREGAGAFAVRNAGLAAVADALTRFVNDLPQEVSEEWRTGKLDAIARLGDGGRNADLLQLTRVMDAYFERKLADIPSDAWRAHRFRIARARVASLAESMGHLAKDISTEPVRLAHPKASGAWVHVMIDELAPRELAECIALRALALQNVSVTRVAPELHDESGRRMRPSEIDCAGRYRLHAPRATVTRAAGHGPVRSFLGVGVQWPHGVAARVAETPGVDGRTASRVLSLWVPREGSRLERGVRLKLPGTTSLRIEYVAGNAAKPRVLGSVSIETPAFTAAPREALAAGGLYVAEAHTNGTLFKRGFGIYLASEIAAGTKLYRSQAIAETRWPDFLFGPEP